MTRMVRGKVIVDGHNVEEENIEAALSSAGKSREGEATGPMDVEVQEEANPLRDGPTFAPPTAPWVGAERAWRLSITGRLDDARRQYPPRSEREEVTQTDFALSDDEVAAVLSSVPPPAARTDSNTTRTTLVRAIQYIGGAALMTAAAAAVFVVAQSVKPAPNLPTASTHTVAIEPNIEISPDVVDVPSRLTTPEPVNSGNAEAAAAASPQSAVENMTFTMSELFPVPAPRTVAEAEPSKARADLAAKPDTAVSNERNDLASAELEASEDQLVAFNLANPYTGTETKDVEAPSTADISESVKPLTRDTVTSVMDGVAAEVTACANGEKGRIVVRFVVSGRTGRVKEAAAAYAPFVDTPVGRCAARAVKRAVFPRFNESEMTIKYAFDF